MTEKTRKQIEAMKQQTIGVEIEMAKITREKACRTVAKFFGTEHTVYRNGNRWYCTDTLNRKWTVANDSSISGELTILAAASLTDVCGELKTMYEAEHSGVTLNFSFAGSGALQTQQRGHDGYRHADRCLPSRTHCLYGNHVQI